MTSSASNVLPLPVDVESLPPLNEPGENWTQLAGRADEGRRTLVDMAAAKLGMPRAHFVVWGATEKAIEVLRAA
jgi:uncharacterized protein (DUF1778 family)